jgi:hypothetical protein
VELPYHKAIAEEVDQSDERVVQAILRRRNEPVDAPQLHKMRGSKLDGHAALETGA